MRTRHFLSIDRHENLVRPWHYEEIGCPGLARAGETQVHCRGKMNVVEYIPFSVPRKALVVCDVCGVKGTVPVLEV